MKRERSQGGSWARRVPGGKRGGKLPRADRVIHRAGTAAAGGEIEFQQGIRLDYGPQTA
jgi:hypothetical protein